MKKNSNNIFQWIALMIFVLISLLGSLFIVITYYATVRYHQASTQLLNKDVAAHIAEFTSPFELDGINNQKADSVFQNAMVLSPSAEVYFLDTSGNILAFHADTNDIRLHKVPLTKIKKYIQNKGSEYITAPDPKDAYNPKIFSAAEVISNGNKLGYIYVILGSKEYKNILALLFKNHSISLAIKAFIAIVLFTILVSFLFVNRLQRRYNKIISVCNNFLEGDLEVRFPTYNGELNQVTSAFNKMADLLTSNIKKLHLTEKERKHFLATISHDLRTPLSVARGYTETLMMEKDPPGISQQERNSYLQLIYNKTLQVENMVKQLFELSKMEAVEFVLDKEPFVLSEIVQETVKAFQFIAAEKEVDLACTQCQYHVWIEADIRMMERVVQNLVENAVNNTPGGGKIQVALSVKNRELLFTIENTGKLLEPDLLAWINNSYDNDQNISYSGKSGLGLLIIKKILYLHSFGLRAHTPEKSRNIFTISMPIYNS